MENDREHLIRSRAYALWEQEGRPEGRHEHHWHQASQEVGDDLHQQQAGDGGAQERPGALDGGLLDMGGLVAGGGPGGAGIGGRGTDGAEDRRQQMGEGDGGGQQQADMGSQAPMGGGLASGLQPGGTIPGGGPGAGMGSVGQGGGPTGGEDTGSPGRQQR